MRVIPTVLILMLAVGTACVLVLQSSTPLPLSSSVPAAVEPVILRPMVELAPQRQPLPEAEKPIPADAPPVAEKRMQPVDSIEERGDAMLFEIDALYGTPFDAAITQPFN